MRKVAAARPARATASARHQRHGSGRSVHVAVGPGGVSVIDTKWRKGKGARADRRLAVLAPPACVLKVARQDRTSLVIGLERQIELVRAALNDHGESEGVEVSGALCFPRVDGLPMFRRQYIRGVLINGPKRVSQLARRAGELDPQQVERIWRELANSFPEA